jgi:hypothetical protein
MTKKSVEVLDSDWASCAFGAGTCAGASAKENDRGADIIRVIHTSDLANIFRLSRGFDFKDQRQVTNSIGAALT